MQVMLNRPIVSILFAAAFLQEVARYSSDRRHLFPFNLLSRTGRILFEIAIVPPRFTYELGMRLRILLPLGSKNLLPQGRTSLLRQRR